MYILLIILTLLLIPTLLIWLLTFIEELKKQIILTLKKSLDRLAEKNGPVFEDIAFFGRKAIGLHKKNKKLVSQIAVTML